MLPAMLIRYFTDLPCSVAEAERALLASPETWVPHVARDADLGARALLANVGIGPAGVRIEKRVMVEVGEPFRLSSKTLVPLSWHAAGPEGFFPVLEGHLEICLLGQRRTQLVLSASYKPPFGPIGAALDRAFLHRVAESTIKHFVDGLAERIVRESKRQMALA